METKYKAYLHLYFVKCSFVKTLWNMIRLICSRFLMAKIRQTYSKMFLRELAEKCFQHYTAFCLLQANKSNTTWTTFTTENSRCVARQQPQLIWFLKVLYKCLWKKKTFLVWSDQRSSEFRKTWLIDRCITCITVCCAWCKCGALQGADFRSEWSLAFSSQSKQLCCGVKTTMI